MSDTVITVTGPGGCISTEMLIIQKALTEFGITVIVEDSHPHCEPDEHLVEMHHRYTQDDWGGAAYPSSKKLTSVVTLKADHRPWGG